MVSQQPLADVRQLNEQDNGYLIDIVKFEITSSYWGNSFFSNLDQILKIFLYKGHNFFDKNKSQFINVFTIDGLSKRYDLGSLEPIFLGSTKCCALALRWKSFSTCWVSLLPGFLVRLRSNYGALLTSSPPRSFTRPKERGNDACISK